MAAKIKEITASDIKNKYSNRAALEKAFKSIKNATIVESNDTTAIILDEENQVFYELQYECNEDTNDILLKDFTPIVIKEEKLNTKKLFAEAMEEDSSEEFALENIKRLASYYARRFIGGERSRLVTEARAKTAGKRIDRGRKQIIEDLNLFKSKNRRLINEVKSNGFYEKFAELINTKYLQDGTTVIVEDKINFNLIDLRNKSRNVKETVYRKRLGKINENKAFFNPVDVIKNSPSFTHKLIKFMDEAHMLSKAGQDEDLTESKEIFCNFAKKWPVLYTINEQKHRDFAIRFFSNRTSDKERAREYVDIYSALVGSEKFQEDQENYLEENYGSSNGFEEKATISNSVYNARILDEVKEAIKTVREKVEKIESFNVQNYLRLAEESLDKMLRSGQFNEEVFEQYASDIFGDSQLVVFNEHRDVLEDDDFKASETEDKKLNEEELKVYALEEKSNRLIIQLRNILPHVEKSLRTTLEEDIDLLKSMTAISSYDEERVNDIERLYEELTKDESESTETELNEDDEEKESYCPNCHGDVSSRLNEAVENSKETFNCPHCGTELKIDGE